MKATEDLEGAGGQVLKDPVLLVGGLKGAFLTFYPYPRTSCPHLRITNLLKPLIKEIGYCPKVGDNEFPGKKSV